ERLALLRIRKGLVECSLGEADAHCGDPNPAAVEQVQELLEAVAARAEEIRLGHAAVLEGERTRVRGIPAHLAVRLADHVPRSAVRDDDVRDLLAAALLAGDGGDDDAARHIRTRVGDELLGAVYDPLAVFEP